MDKIKVGIIGVTGFVGRQLFNILKDHPYFEISFLGASKDSVGKKISDIESVPNNLRNLVIKDASELPSTDECKIIFSAIPSEIALDLERRYAEEGFIVISNSSAYRMNEYVPIIIPEINSDHLNIINFQKYKGSIICKSNCALQSFIIPLFALKKFLPESINITSMQSISGAGTLDLDSINMNGNIIPYIYQEEEKVIIETKKILGSLKNDKIHPYDINIDVSCLRVPTLFGHMADITLHFKEDVSKDDILEEWKNFKNLNLPSSPKVLLNYNDDVYFPQNIKNLPNMDISIGRLRKTSTGGYKFIALSNNLLRGAAGGSVLSAELLIERKLI